MAPKTKVTFEKESDSVFIAEYSENNRVKLLVFSVDALG